MSRAFLVFAWLMVTMASYGQYTLRGEVTDEQKTPLPGANVVLSELKLGTVTRQDGSFTLGGIPGGTYTLKITFVGYEAHTGVVKLSSDTDMGIIPLASVTFMGEESIVTATRAGSRTPVAYSEMEREEITSRNFGQDVPYLLSSTPSLVVSSDAGHGIGYSSMRIRGTDANRINVTINGIPLNDAESHSVYWVDLPDIATSVDNIQIQRGVGTSTNGAAAFGASVNFQLQKLQKEPFAIYDGTFGSYGTVRSAISTGTGLIKEHFSVDMRLSDLHSDGYIDRSWTDLRSYYLSAGYYDSRTLLKFITFSGTEELYQAWNGVPAELLESDRTYNELGAYSDENGVQSYYDNQVDHYKQEHYQLHFSREVSDKLYLNSALHFTRGAGYYEQYKEDELLSDYSMEKVVIGGDTIFESDLIRRKWLDNNFYGIVGGLHFREENFNMVLGGGWNRYDGDHFGTVIWARYTGDNDIRHRWYENNGSKTDWNSYLKTTFEAGNMISLFADLQIRGIDYGIVGEDDDLRIISQKHDYFFFNPKAGVNLQLSSSHRAYLFLARANREPNRSNFVDADPAGPVPVKETLIDYEAGYNFTGQDLKISANLYFMDYTDQLVLTGEINDVGSAIMSNVKDSYRAGIELSFSFRFASWIRWDMNTTLSRNRILNYTGYVDNWDYWTDPENQPYQVEEALGSTALAFSPEFIFNSMIDAEPLRSFHLIVSSRYVGRQFIDNTSSPERALDPYFINDLTISHSFYPHFMEEISLQLQVVNLLNVMYESNAWVYRYYFEGVEGVLDGFFPQAGRHLMAGIRLRF